jgi:hypothetical protein
MGKIYQPVVIEKVNEIIGILTQINFFKDYEIDNLEFAKSYFSDLFTQKFIEGKLNDNDELLTENEFEKCLKEIISGTLLYELKNKGYIDSYGDDITEERFFLTEEGKKYLKDLSEDESI